MTHRISIGHIVPPLGAALPDVALENLQGDTVHLRGPALIVIAGEADRLSCGSFHLEFRILHRKFPALQTYM